MKRKKHKCHECRALRYYGEWAVINMTEDYDGEDAFFCAECCRRLDNNLPSKSEEAFLKKHIPCGRRGCSNYAARLISWFSLTGEYTKDNKQVALCINCDDARLFNQEINRQMQEANGDEEY